MHGKLKSDHAWKIKIQIMHGKFSDMYGYTYHIEKNAGTNMIRTEDQTIRTIIFFVQV